MNAAAPLVQAKAGRDLFGMFKGLKQTVVNGLVATKPPPVEQETDTEFLAHKARFEDLQQQLTTTSQQVFSPLKLLLSETFQLRVLVLRMLLHLLHTQLLILYEA